MSDDPIYTNMSIRRIDELERRLSKLEDPKWFGDKYRESQMWATHESMINGITELKKKVKDLEEKVNLHHYELTIEILKRIEELERYLTGAPNFVTPSSNSKFPHKCPMCEGFGKTYSDFSGLNMAICNSCEGKGIVWG